MSSIVLITSLDAAGKSRDLLAYDNGDGTWSLSVVGTVPVDTHADLAAILTALSDGTQQVRATTPPAPVAYTIGTGTLGTAGTYSAGADVTVGARRKLTWEVVYTGGGATAQAGYRVRVGHTANPGGKLPVLDGSIAVSGTAGTRASYDGAVKLPVSGVGPYTFILEVEVAGWTYAALDVVELVKDTSFGTVTAKIGGAY